MQGVIWPTADPHSHITCALPRKSNHRQDMEIEIDRFDIIRTNALKKYTMMTPPEGKPKDKAALGVDAICMLCMGEHTNRV